MRRGWKLPKLMNSIHWEYIYITELHNSKREKKYTCVCIDRAQKKIKRKTFMWLAVIKMCVELKSQSRRLYPQRGLDVLPLLHPGIGRAREFVYFFYSAYFHAI